MDVPDTAPNNEVINAPDENGLLEPIEINPRTNKPYKTPYKIREANKFSKLRKKEIDEEKYILSARAYMRTYQAKRYHKARMLKKLTDRIAGVKCLCVCCELNELEKNQHNISPLTSSDNSDADTGST